MVFVRAILAAAVCVALSTATPVHKRQTTPEDPCRHEGLFVGGTVVGNGYIEQVQTEADCIQKCQDLADCQAINYFPEHKACLPQVEALQGENVDSLATAAIANTVYVIVKNCDGDSLNPENNRKKREAESENSSGCRLENVHVGGEPALGDGYIVYASSEEACVEQCNKLEQCTAVTYWAEFGDCAPQIQSLADPEFKDRLSSRVSPGAVYVVVKGCSGGLEVPENILPEAETESSESNESEESKSQESEDASSGHGSDETTESSSQESEETTEELEQGEEDQGATEEPDQNEEATEEPEEQDEGNDANQ